ncbi:FAR1-related sequence 5-like protein [Tanacetum coccineum]|uniref:FAR1-related sequence 5-like protein n=1 Tax=Tanacetum coccineum TaxID=301880 RepID=A0ABQ5IW05_9ASTR
MIGVTYIQDDDDILMSEIDKNGDLIHECKDLVTLLSKEGIRPSEITKIVNAYRGNHEHKLTRVQCSTIVSGERRRNMGKECHGVIMHFKERAEVDKDFYFAMDLSIDGTLRNVFWADGRSRSSYSQFGDVVIFDVTYKTNKLCLPFAPFVGVNHHNQTILLGGALLENETEITFTWLFKQFLKCMHDCPPVSIITDQDLAMGIAIGKVFPQTRHRYCAWHIQKHVLEHLQPLRSQYDDFQDTYTKWVKSQNIEDYETKWEELKEKYHIDDDCWLGNMYKLRHHWIKAYLKDTFFAGMTTSGRSESIHSFFDGFVNSKTMLNDFVVQYDKAVNSRRSAEGDQDFRTLDSKPTLHSNHPIEAMAAKYFATCSCARFETCGILCKHILYIMKRKLLVSIPDHYILPRWKMKATYNGGSIGKRWRRVHDNANQQVSFMTLWSIRSKFNKLLEGVRDSPCEIEKLNTFFDDCLNKQHQRHIIGAEVNSVISTMPAVTQSEQDIIASHPVNRVKTKGHPKAATRIKSGLEISKEAKKRKKCSYCKLIGHNITKCPKKKMDEAKANNNVEVPLE